MQSRHIQFLTTPLFEKEAYRVLFTTGGGLDVVDQSGVSGVQAARENAADYVSEVVALLQRTSSGDPAPASPPMR